MDVTFETTSTILIFISSQHFYLHVKQELPWQLTVVSSVKNPTFLMQCYSNPRMTFRAVIHLHGWDLQFSHHLPVMESVMSFNPWLAYDNLLIGLFFLISSCEPSLKGPCMVL